jgi:hypothetical protein
LKLVGNKTKRATSPSNVLDAEYSVVKKSSIPLTP